MSLYCWLVGWLVGEVVISVGKSVIIVDGAVTTNAGRSKAVMLRIRESEKSTDFIRIRWVRKNSMMRDESVRSTKGTKDTKEGGVSSRGG